MGSFERHGDRGCSGDTHWDSHGRAGSKSDQLTNQSSQPAAGSSDSRAESKSNAAVVCNRASGFEWKSPVGARHTVAILTTFQFGIFTSELTVTAAEFPVDPGLAFFADAFGSASSATPALLFWYPRFTRRI
jgi:hypothetical protein